MLLAEWFTIFFDINKTNVHRCRRTADWERKRGEPLRRIHAAFGDSLMQGNLTFGKQLFQYVVTGQKTQTTRDFIAWRWNRIIAEIPEGRNKIVIERSQYKRDVLGVLEVRGAALRRLVDMQEREWKEECVEQMELRSFADKYLRRETPLESCVYTKSYCGSKGLWRRQERKVGVLLLGKFTGVNAI